MLVNVKTVILTNTRKSATSALSSVLCDLNREETLSDSEKKTCFNSPRGGLGFIMVLLSSIIKLSITGLFVPRRTLC